MRGISRCSGLFTCGGYDRHKSLVKQWQSVFGKFNLLSDRLRWDLKVFFRIGKQKMTGEVIEDRGSFGKPPRRILRIQSFEAPGASDELTSYELPADMLSATQT